MRHAAHANRFASKVKGWSVTLLPMRSMALFGDAGTLRTSGAERMADGDAGGLADAAGPSPKDGLRLGSS